MKEINFVIDCLERTPVILVNLLDQIPQDLYKVRRVANKWCIHEQVCHLVHAQEILMGRFRQFEVEEDPLIRSYSGPLHAPEDQYLKMNMDVELERFPMLRAEMIKVLRSFDKSYWLSNGRHEFFSPYNTQILLTHTLNVDYAHIFSIEQLGLTKPGLEEDILTVP